MRERCFAVEPVGVVAGGDEQGGGGLGADAVAGDERGGGGGHEGTEDGVDACDLGVEGLDAAGELAERELGRSVGGGRIGRS